MKMVKSTLMILFVLVFGLVYHLEAQTEDAKPWFEMEAQIVGDIDVNASYITVDAASTKLSQSLLQQVGISSMNTKFFRGPITVKVSNSCVTFKCETGCRCIMAWRDKNKDGKIQPRTELRCVCPNTQKLCKIRAKIIPC